MTTVKKQEAIPLSQIQPTAANARHDTAPPLEETDNSAAQNIGQIRDILFGREMSRYEKRFNQIEARLTERTDQIKDEMSRRLDAIEAIIRKETESFTNKLNAEKDARTQQGLDLAGELKSTAAALTQSVSRLQDELKQTSELQHRQFLDHVKELNEKMTSNHDEITSALEKSTRQLKTDKVDRSALSSLLIHLAGQLSPSSATASMKTPSDHE